MLDGLTLKSPIEKPLLKAWLAWSKVSKVILRFFLMPWVKFGPVTTTAEQAFTLLELQLLICITISSMSALARKCGTLGRNKDFSDL